MGLGWEVGRVTERVDVNVNVQCHATSGPGRPTDFHLYPDLSGPRDSGTLSGC